MLERTPEATGRPAVPVVDADDLRQRVADLVVGDPGVVRIEPTLSSALRSLADEHDPADAVRLDVRSRVVDVELSIATAPGHQARELAHRLQDGVATLIEEAGLVPGSVEIHVLSIEVPDGTDSTASA